MKLEDQVVSLELAKRLKELGCKQESLFKWACWPNAPKDNTWAEPTIVESTNELAFGNRAKTSSAYTVAELDEVLMKTDYAIIAQHDGHWVFKRKENTTLEYGMIGGRGMGPMKTGADRRASLLVYLLENNLLQ